MVDDAQLLRDYVETGSESAFRELVQRHVDLVYATALARLEQQTQLAEEVTQRVFSDLAQKSAALTRHSSLVGWLFTSTRFAASNLARIERRRRQREQTAFEMNALSSDPEPDWAKLQPYLQGTLDELKREDREVVLLRFFEKRPFADIGRRLQLSDMAAQKRVERSLEKLRGRLLKRGLTSSAAALNAALAGQAFAAPAGLGVQVATTALSQMAVGGAAATALGAATLMSTTKIALSVGGLAALLLAGAGTSAWLDARQSAADLTLAREQNAHLNQAIAALANRTGRAAATPTAPVGFAAAIPTASAPPLDARTVFSRNPALAKKALRLQLRQMYGAVYGKLGLTPQQIDQLENLLIDNKYRKEYGDPPPSAEERGAMEANMMSAATALIGADNVRQLEVYDDQHSYREKIQAVAAQTYLTDSPLTADQGSRMFALLVGNAAKQAADPTRPGPVSTVDWETVLAQAQGLFPPAQIAALKSLALSAQFDRQFNELLSAQSAPVTP